MSEPTYTINLDGSAITCLRCGLTSHHPMDVSHRYCGQCHVFHTTHDTDLRYTQEPPAASDLQAENAALRARLESCLQRGDMEAAKMAALIEACEVFAEFVEAYGVDSPVAQALPMFYANLRVYGKNARAAVIAVRPQADALLARLNHAEVGLKAEQELRARTEMIVLAARRLVAGPDSENYTRLAQALDAYDRAMHESNVTERARLFNTLLNQGKEGSE